MDESKKQTDHDVVALAEQLIRFSSVSHQSNEIISLFVKNHLEAMNFQVEWHTFADDRGKTKVSLVAKRGSGSGGIAYLAHTDVVSADDWSVSFCGPFSPIVRDEKLYGRGACDMKGSLAAALCAASLIHPSDQSHPIYFVITADEEVGMQGAKQVDRESPWFQEMVEGGTMGIVGEPTNLGIYHAHKGGQRLVVRARGVSAHTSTAEGLNANYQLIPALPELLALRQESETNPNYRNTDFEPPTLSWNMTIVNEPQAVNVTPSLAQAHIFLRTMPDVDHQPLLAEIQKICDRHRLECEFNDPCRPWQVDEDASWIQTMLEITNTPKSKTVCFATDAGILQRLEQLVICGPGSIEQAHRSDEWIHLDQLSRGVDVFRSAFERWACRPSGIDDRKNTSQKNPTA